ncbi:ATP-grasp fold amidoligase family protein [Altererythrobacter aquiaggeris]|uniref:ATP-grasp fold amidoligase family protein n=1 Tax=Aestuarierythrobacter aquiaggeris TaxID=1898396 RepID=UPI0030184FD0
MHGRFADLGNPDRFTELVQMRKLLDRDPRMTQRSDKLNAKSIVGDALGYEWIIPTKWQGTRLPRQNEFCGPTIVKSSHGCNQYHVMREPPSALQWNLLRARSARWMRGPYGYWLDEWCYRDVPLGLLAEGLVGDSGALPVDYKIYVFGGRATHVQVHLNRSGNHTWILHDRDFTKLVPQQSGEAVKPDSLQDMLAAAEELARGFSFVRVDFYEVGRRPLFGEFCFYPGSGLDPFAADWVDAELGQLWKAAL